MYIKGERKERKNGEKKRGRKEAGQGKRKQDYFFLEKLLLKLTLLGI